MAISDAELADLNERLLQSRYQDKAQRRRQRTRPSSTYRCKAESRSNTQSIPTVYNRHRSRRFNPVTVHFIHAKSTAKGTLLLFAHGWPGSFLEGTKEGTPAFNIITPSFVNFIFSGGLRQQGGDWGAFITRAMASAYSPHHLKAQHLYAPAQTLGHELTDSPVRLLAWVYEKLYN
ncbi:Alpha/Beta hydrolase protein [Nemania sp. FL0031]|nr:Alpha/Beta hydrolase protein [Nemania sp. FL0031]